jgi:D-alanyl-D-alanine carboxypeptidase
MATLSVALIRDFPQYYGYFKRTSFKYAASLPRPQQAAEELQGLRRHQDRLHPRLRLQPGELGRA